MGRLWERKNVPIFAAKYETKKTIIMCTITQETIRKACERTIANGRKNTACHSGKSSDIDLSVKFKGGEYHGRITMDEMRKAYGHAWEKTLSR